MFLEVSEPFLMHFEGNFIQKNVVIWPKYAILNDKTEYVLIISF